MSNSSTATNSSGGLGFAGALTILFIGLKLTGYITWSWWWVLSPLWISALLVIGILVIVGIAILIMNRMDERDRRKRRASRVDRARLR